MSDFDFLYGDWTVVNRRLGTLFSGSDDWEEFPGTQRAWELLDGAANVDESVFPTKGWSGATFRLFNPETQLWSIWWASGQTGTLFPPVTGRFVDGRGDFYGDDEHDGKPIRAHFIWSHITPTSARWEQEFSNDGGETWETSSLPPIRTNRACEGSSTCLTSPLTTGWLPMGEERQFLAPRSIGRQIGRPVPR